MARYRDAFQILSVADMQRSLGFYRDLLGFEVQYAFPSEDEPGFVSLSLAGGGKLGLGLNPDTAGGPFAATWLYTDDVDNAVDELRAAGVEVKQEPVDQPWGERQATVVDPDGYDVHIGART
jgi:uncharacterized glyoxalase superfamily protein PhnB